MQIETLPNKVCIGVFIHNEESCIELCLQSLVNQSIFHAQNPPIQVYLLCNGCTDNSVQIASKIARDSKFIVIDWPEGGKSRTWNRFVHEIVSDKNTNIVFLDGDILLHESRTVEKLLAVLNTTPANVATSKPVKNTSIYSYWNPLRLIASVIKRPHQDGAIAGSLYAMKGKCAQEIWLPRICLVEDGFIAATVITKHFQSSETDKSLVKSVQGTCHIFDPPANLGEFFQHDVRLALGTELNAALYTPLWHTKSLLKSVMLLKEFSTGSKIDSAITEHIVKRHNHTFGLNRTIRYAWPKGQSFRRGLLLLPLRSAHMIYMGFVFKSAWKKFKDRQFKW